MPPHFSRQGQSWTDEEDRKLYELTVAGLPFSKICEEHQRSEGGIKARQVRLGLRDEQSSALVQPPPPFRPSSRLQKQTPTRTNSITALEVDGAPQIAPSPQGHRQAGSLPQLPGIYDWIDLIWEGLERDINEIFLNKAPETSDRNTHILLARLSPGEDYFEHVTLQDLGEAYGVSRERIRQISSKGERRLKTRIRSRRGWTYPILCQFQATHEDMESAQLFRILIQTLVDGDVTQQFGHFIIAAFGRINSLPARDISRYEIAFRDVSIEKAKQGKSAEAKARSSERKRRRADAFVSKVLSGAIFSGTFAVEGARLLAMPRLRSCNRERTLFSETLGRAVQWESYAERRFIQALDHSSIISEFAEQPVEVNFLYQGRQRKYFVDLLVKTVDDLTVAVEIKSPVMLADRYVQAKAQAATQAFGQYGIGYCLVDARGRTRDDILRIEVTDQLKNFLRDTLRAKKKVTMRDLYGHFGHWPSDDVIDQIQRLVLEFGLDYRVRLLPNRKTGQLGMAYTFTLTTGRNRRPE